MDVKPEKCMVYSVHQTERFKNSNRKGWCIKEKKNTDFRNDKI